MVYRTRGAQLAERFTRSQWDSARQVVGQLFQSRRSTILTVFVVWAIVVVSGGWAMVRTPAWYEPPIIPPERWQQVRDNLLNAEQAFTESLRAGPGAFTYHLYQDDVNAWIAMRREIYPLIDELAPPQLEDPYIVIDDDEITLAGGLRAGGIKLIVSIDLAAELIEEEIVLRVSALRCGSVRVPTALFDLPLRQEVRRDANKTWPGSPPIHGNLIDGLRIADRATWKNGGIPYRVTHLEANDGVLDLTIQPLERPASKRRRRH